MWGTPLQSTHRHHAPVTAARVGAVAWSRVVPRWACRPGRQVWYDHRGDREGGVRRDRAHGHRPHRVAARQRQRRVRPRASGGPVRRAPGHEGAGLHVQVGRVDGDVLPAAGYRWDGAGRQAADDAAGPAGHGARAARRSVTQPRGRARHGAPRPPFLN